MPGSSLRRRVSRRARPLVHAAACIALLHAAPAWGQTDFANTDAGRPLRTQDAIVLERFAFEAHLPTFRALSRHGAAVLSVDPVLAFGIAARTQLDVGLAIESSRRATGGSTSFGERQLRLDAVHAGVLHQLNVETLGLPAIALGAEVKLPAGAGAGNPVWGGTAVVTRTWGATRTHLNARVATGSHDEAVDASELELSAALDRTLPLKHLLWGAELGTVSRKGADAMAWYGGAGLRWQWTVRTSVDAGVERTFSAEPGWAFSLGMSTAFGLRSFTRGYR